MVSEDRLESSLVAAIVVENLDLDVPTTEQVSEVVAAMEALARAGLRLVLIDGDRTRVTVSRSEDRRRWWHRRRETR
jgi:hypothetical protein